jgi:FRG domain
MGSPCDTTVRSLGCVERVLVELVREFGEQLWWRGHWDAKWPLLPSGFRDNRLEDGRVEPRNPVGLIQNFRNRAAGRLGHRRVPESEIEWLFLAQHYGLPTQLLDWTENPLVALFFAVSGDEKANQDGCLWALSPTVLNQFHENPFAFGNGQRGLRETDEPLVRAIAMRAFGMKEEVVAERIFPKSNWDSQGISFPKLIALAGRETDERVIAQLGRFTLHHLKSALEELGEHERFLRRYLIPAEVKSDLKSVLESFGIRKWNLFPDLQTLAEGLSTGRFVE